MAPRGRGPAPNPLSATQQKRNGPKARPRVAQNRLAFALQVYVTEAMPYTAATRAIMDKFGVSRTTAQNDLRRAGAMAVAAELEEAKVVRARVSSALWRSRAAAHMKGDHSAAVSAMRALISMHGLAKATVNVAMTGSVGINLGALGFKSPEEVRDRIEELRARLKQDGPMALSGVHEVDASTCEVELNRSLQLIPYSGDHSRSIPPT